MDTDKTLVSWVKVDDWDIRGGTIITIQDEDRFDGICLSKEAEGIWLAGSEDDKRTREDGTMGYSIPSEDEFEQVAIVYEGSEIRIYRNGDQTSSYKANNIDLLISNTNLIVFGPVHHGSAGWISGSIEDARIYGSALGANDLKNLEPNEPSEIEPYAWFDFEGEEIVEKTGRYTNFYMGEYDNAKLDDGKLVLKGWGRLTAFREYIPQTPSCPDNPPDNWPTFHLAHPGPGLAVPGDPNAAFFYNGRYHLHYIYDIPYGFSFAHVSSDDMVHWQWHPTVLTPPNTGHGMFSGTGFFTREEKPALIYHGFGSGYNQLTFALDDNLDKWSSPEPILPVDENGEQTDLMDHWDPDCWLIDDTYYALSGGKDPELMKSSNLKNWIHSGKLLHDEYPENLGVSRKEDISCANMFKIGDKWMLLCISHRLGCRYFLGDFKDEKYLPDFHALMNWRDEDHTITFFAPESLLTSDGRRVMWAWIISDASPSGIQSLPRELELPDDGILRIKPLRELKSLRYNEISKQNITVNHDDNHNLPEITGDALELEVTFSAPVSQEFGLILLGDENGENGMSITAGAGMETLNIGSVNPPFELQEGEDLILRIFIDKNLAEVFANDRQAAVFAHKHIRENPNISLFTRDKDVVVKEVKAWKIMSIYEGETVFQPE